jgi:hypothetical protein
MFSRFGTAVKSISGYLNPVPDSLPLCNGSEEYFFLEDRAKLIHEIEGLTKVKFTLIAPNSIGQTTFSLSKKRLTEENTYNIDQTIKFLNDFLKDGKSNPIVQFASSHPIYLEFQPIKDYNTYYTSYRKAYNSHPLYDNVLAFVQYLMTLRCKIIDDERVSIKTLLELINPHTNLPKKPEPARSATTPRGKPSGWRGGRRTKRSKRFKRTRRSKN